MGAASTAAALGDWVEGLPRPGVGCVIVKIVGSAPQAVGARMWVTEREFSGTLGGGRFELEVIEHGRRLLRDASAGPELKEYVLCREMGQCCGGRVHVFFEPVRPRRRVAVFGGGHVGRALAQVLSGMPLETTLVDARPEWAAKESLPADVAAVIADPLGFAAAREWGAGDAVCILTHSHDLDFELARFFLERSVGYLGLIGSEHKAEVFRARLLGLPEGERLVRAWDERMRCPIGAGLPASKSPKVIAVAIAGELLKDWALSEAAVEARG